MEALLPNPSITANIKRKKKPPIGAVHRLLRTATREIHADNDRTLLRFNLERLDDYKTLLQIHFNTLRALRECWRPKDGPDFEQMINRVVEDLKTLDCQRRSRSLEPIEQLGANHGLGVGYFIRGSRLLGAALRQKIAPAVPTSYLDFEPSISWADFLVELETIGDNRFAKEEAIRGANAANALLATEYTEFQYLIAPRLSRAIDFLVPPRQLLKLK